MTCERREFGFLKHHFGLAAIRVRRIERVRLHADLVILARLTLALSRLRSADRDAAGSLGGMAA